MNADPDHEISDAEFDQMVDAANNQLVRQLIADKYGLKRWVKVLAFKADLRTMTLEELTDHFGYVVAGADD